MTTSGLPKISPASPKSYLNNQNPKSFPKIWWSCRDARVGSLKLLIYERIVWWVLIDASMGSDHCLNWKSPILSERGKYVGGGRDLIFVWKLIRLFCGYRSSENQLDFLPKIMIIISNVIKAFILSPLIFGGVEKAIQAAGTDLENIWQLGGEILPGDCKLLGCIPKFCKWHGKLNLQAQCRAQLTFGAKHVTISEIRYTYISLSLLCVFNISFEYDKMPRPAERG